jgi:hypothetical protein
MHTQPGHCDRGTGSHQHRVVAVNPHDTDPDTVLEAIEKYRPLRDIRSWNVIADFVRTTVFDLQPPTVQAARNYLMVLTQYADWAYVNQGFGIGEHLFDHLVADSFITDWGRARKGRTAAVKRGILNDLIRRHNDTGDRRELPDRPMRSHPNVAYTDADLPKLHAWAATRRVLRVRRTASALITLGLGFGLEVGDLCIVRGKDIDDRGADGLLLTLPDRTIWCDELHEPSLRRVLADADDPGSPLLQFKPGSNPKAFLNAARKASRPADALVPELPRLRTTWFVRRAQHFSALVAVMRAYGISHTSTLQTVIEQLPTPTPDEVRRVLRTERPRP